MPHNPTLSDWAKHLHAIADPIATPALPKSEGAVADFRDEFGHKRAVDGPMIRHLCEFTVPQDSSESRRTAEPDAKLWWMALDDEPDPWTVIEPGDGSLTRRSADDQIEVWTETELSALHAAWTIAAQTGDVKLVDRCLAAAVWHIAELQPDNGTNHPWAIHVFLELWSRSDIVEARLYAETLLHNCTVQQGQPDIFSAVILLHAARGLASGLH